MSLLTGMVAVGGRPKPGEVSEGSGRARLCAYVKQLTLNSAIEQELLDRRVEGRANATSSAWHRLCPCESLHSKGLDKIYKKAEVFHLRSPGSLDKIRAAGSKIHLDPRSWIQWILDLLIFWGSWHKSTNKYIWIWQFPYNLGSYDVSTDIAKKTGFTSVSCSGRT